MNAVKLEAEKHGIRINTVAPVALTRMTEGLPLARMLGEATPDRVAAGVAYLASSASDFSGVVLAAGDGCFSTVRLVEGKGVHAAVDEISPEFVASNWARICDPSGARPFASAVEALTGAPGPTSS